MHTTLTYVDAAVVIVLVIVTVALIMPMVMPLIQGGINAIFPAAGSK